MKILLTTTLTLLLLLFGIAATQSVLPAKLNVPTLDSDKGQCPTAEHLDAIKSQLNDDVDFVLRNTVIPILQNNSANPYSSCMDIPAGNPPGYYWIQTNAGSPSLQYCDPGRCAATSTSCGNTAEGWISVANIDMTDQSQQCPPEFHQSQRTCAIPAAAEYSTPACVSITFPVNGLEYSNVCGRIKAYAQGAHGTEAFWRFHVNAGPTIDDNFADGVYLTHGQSPRKHIWTFVSTTSESQTRDVLVCPCHRADGEYTLTTPPFIGQDYFCDAGNNGDPLWDGQGCGPTSSCCSFNNPPWFCKQLPEPTRDDIELRSCVWATSHANIAIEVVEIKIR